MAEPQPRPDERSDEQQRTEYLEDELGIAERAFGVGELEVGREHVERVAAVLSLEYDEVEALVRQRSGALDVHEQTTTGPVAAEPSPQADAAQRITVGAEPAPPGQVEGETGSAARALPAPAGWPAPPAAEAFQGLPGRIVSSISPHSEADPAALLTQTLGVAGSLIGRGPHVVVEADRHCVNLYLTLVGETSKSRKGSSYAHVERLGEAADPSWRDRVERGLTSGEGLIWRLRDPVRDGEEEDPGEPDKRLLVVESEFASVLRVLERSGNRLSTVCRDAWDGRPLGTLTRTTTAKATGTHVSIIGHITADELRRYLDRTETANGFGNRFLWACVRRHNILPDGGQMWRVNVQPLVDELRQAITLARKLGRVDRDEQASALWHDVYPELSEGRPGLSGALTGRGEAQVVRLSLLYALLDKSNVIQAQHLRAALALWDYCRRSVEHIFGRSLGDPIADSILDALDRAAPSPLSRTDIRSVVGGRIEAHRIDNALALLVRHRLAHMEQHDTGGRPAELWHLGPTQATP